MSAAPGSRRCKVTLAAFCVAALILWAAGVVVTAMRVHMGIPTVIDSAAVAATVMAFTTHVTQEIHGGERQSLARQREELRRDTEALLRLAGALLSQHDAPAAPAPHPLRVVQQSPRLERAGTAV